MTEASCGTNRAFYNHDDDDEKEEEEEAVADPAYNKPVERRLRLD